MRPQQLRLVSANFFRTVGGAHAGNWIIRPEIGNQFREESRIFLDGCGDLVGATDRTAIATFKQIG